MFALKYLLKNVQRIDITPAYINTVITKEAGKAAMQLACQVAVDVYSGKDISYLDQPNMESGICFDREITFSNILKTYVTNEKDLYQGVYTRNLCQSWGGLNLGIFLGRAGDNRGAFSWAVRADIRIIIAFLNFCCF